MSRSPAPVTLVTGASAGIGLAVATSLARLGHRVLVHTRAGQKGSAGFEQVRTAATGPAAEHLPADLSSMEDVRRLAREVRATAPALDVVVHNAAIVTPVRQTTIDGHEMQFAVNHLAVYLLTHELMPALRAAPGARVVVTASQVERSGRIDFADLMSGSRYQKDEAYSRSKLANVLFTYELARRLAGSTITANCLHPGVVRTGLLNTLLGEEDQGGGGLKGAISGILRKTRLRAPVKDWALTTEAGSDTTLRLATDPALAGTSGRYFSVGQVGESSPQSKDVGLQRELWDVSAQLTGIAPEWP